jgi:D-threo-aldose 1-dehydrogenase
MRAGGLGLTRLSLGGAPLGNLYAEITDAEAAATVAAAWQRGIRYFDTAPHYGLGLSERRLGAALRVRPRDEYVISTKVGRLLVPADPPRERDDQGFAVAGDLRRAWDFSRDGIRRSLEASLARLGLDRVDIAYLHDPDDHYRDVIESGYPALHELRAEGVVRAIGAGMNQAEMLADFVRHTDMDVIMLAGRYTLLEQPALDALLPECERRGVAVVAAGVYNSGLLATPRPARDAKYDYADAPAELLARVNALAAVCERHGVTLPQAALAFPLAHPAVVSVCVGARSPQEVAGNAELLAASPPAALWAELKANGLLRPDAPV